MREAKRFGEEIAAEEPRIDVLINNTGAIFSDRRITAEGLERTIARLRRARHGRRPRPLGNQ